MEQPELGIHIAMLRKQAGLTQEELVEKCNINVRTIQRIENGEVSPRAYTIRTILDALGANIDEAFQDARSTSSDRDHIKTGTFSLLFAVFGVLFLLNDVIFNILHTYWYMSELEGLNITPEIIWVSFSIIFALIFHTGLFKIGSKFNNVMMKFASIYLLICYVLWYGTELWLWSNTQMADDYEIMVMIITTVFFGMGYILLAMGFYIDREFVKPFSRYICISSLVSGVLFLTVVFGIIGIFTTVVLDVFIIVLFYKLYVLSNKATS